ncbi:MAG: kelch repeat-containing protein [Gemmatimonadota bacterium]|nr:kelch repeat-containing protein [Gemmatimonadota bacterium]
MSCRMISALAIVSILMGCGSPVPTSPKATSDLIGFEVAGKMTERRFWHASVLLQDGTVLITGGAATQNPGQVSTSLFRTSSEVFDPETGTTSRRGNLSLPRTLDMGILMPDGRVLLAGADQAPLEFFDPQTGRFTPEPYLPAFARIWSITLLPDGKVLTYYSLGVAIFDPDTREFTSLPGTVAIRAGHTATLLRDGRVLIVGGGNASGIVKESEIYDPLTNTLTRTGDLRYERQDHRAILLQDGSVLVIGGSAGDEGSEEPVTAAERYDPATGTFLSEGDPGFDAIHAATLLPSGEVFIIGDSGEVILYDPATGAFGPTGDSIGENRVFYTTTLLRDGRVLIVGGLKDLAATDQILIYRP